MLCQRRRRLTYISTIVFPLTLDRYTKQQFCYEINSLSASLLLNIFLSFEVGIAHAIANFK